MATPALRDDTLLDASKPHGIGASRPVRLKIPLGRRLSPAAPRHLAGPPVKRLSRVSSSGPRAGFFPGMGEELNATEVVVGYDDQDGLAGVKKRTIKGHAAAKVAHLAPAQGFMPGFGAFDVGSLMTGRNIAIAAAAVGAWFLLKRRR